MSEKKTVMEIGTETRARIQLIKATERLPNAESVIKMLIRFYESGWQNRELHDKIIADIKPKEGKHEGRAV